MTKRTAKRLKKSGQAVIEMIFSMIMFTIMVALICTVCIYLYVQHAIVSAAREGARIASINTNLGGANVAAGQSAVRNQVKAFFLQTTGQTLSDSDIVVSGPTGAFGERDVTVSVSFEISNPINIAGFVSAFGGNDYSGIQNIPVSATAAMRYEE